jgi:hypothetical protein
MIYVYNVKITNNNFCLGKKGEIFTIPTRPEIWLKHILSAINEGDKSL